MKLSKKIVSALTLVLLLALVFYPMYWDSPAGLYPLLIGSLVFALVAASCSFSILSNQGLGFLCCRLKKIVATGKGGTQDKPIDDLPDSVNSAELSMYSAQVDNATSTAMLNNQEANQVQAGVMVENNRFEIIYMSANLIDILKRLENDTDDRQRANIEADPLCARAAQTLTNSRREDSVALHVGGQVIRLPILLF